MKTQSSYSYPTYYHNRRYRSRLEATWAVFMDLVGWEYEYESYDLKQYSPDFIIYTYNPTTKRKDKLLIEVKPYCSFNDFEINKVTSKIEKSLCNNYNAKILLLGEHLFRDSIDPNHITNSLILGWIGVPINKTEYQYTEAIIECDDFYNISRNQPLDFYYILNQTKSSGQITGVVRYGTFYETSIQEMLQVEKLWNLARNRVQWIPEV